MTARTAKGNSRQHDAAHVLDRYGIPPSPVRDVLIDYLTEIRPGLDYGSWVHHVHTLGRAFWWEILQINAAQIDLRLAPHVVARGWPKWFVMRRATGGTCFLRGRCGAIKTNAACSTPSERAGSAESSVTDSAGRPGPRETARCWVTASMMRPASR